METKLQQSSDTPEVKEEGTPIVESGGTPTEEESLLGVGEVTSDVEAAAVVVEAPTTKPRKKVATKAKRKKPTAKSKRPRQVANPVAPPPPPLTLQELKEQGAQAKKELVSAVIEPALEAAGSLSQTIRDTIGGAFAGLLSRKKRD